MGTDLQIDNSQFNDQVNTCHDLERLAILKDGIMCYRDPYMVNCIENISDSMGFQQFNEQMHNCCITKEDTSDVIQFDNITANATLKNASTQKWSNNSEELIETSIVEMTKSELENNTMGEVTPQDNVSRSGIEAYKGRTFGFIPFSIPRIQIRNQAITCIFQNSSKWLYSIHSKVAAFSVPNYKGARIQVPSGLNIPEWRYLLKNYDLKILGEYLQFGFPLNVDYDVFQFNEEVENHASALQRPEGVDKYFNVEVEKQAMVGPIEEIPFKKLHVSPLMGRDKPDGGVRVIEDLSWPLGQSVNSCVDADVYDGIPFTLKYPTVDDVVQQIRTLGPRTLLFKIDLERTFRNLRIDPSDYPLLCLQWQGKRYVDVGLPFGFRTGAAAFQMCTDVITHHLRLRNVWVINYLDDYKD